MKKISIRETLMDFREPLVIFKNPFSVNSPSILSDNLCCVLESIL